MPFRFGDNLCLATHQSDSQWSSFVRWTVLATISAEPMGITQRLANQMPFVYVFGSKLERMFRDGIHGVGNIGEMYARHVERYIPRSGRNLVHTVDDDGPQIYVVPWNDD